jgi:hypothetical protein
MKIILIPLIWVMIPVAFIVLAFDIAKAYVEEKFVAEAKLKEKNC